MAVITQPRAASSVRTPLFIVGVALALVAFLAMFAFGILFASRSVGGQQVPVVMASEDITAREPIVPGMLTLGQVPSGAIPPKAFFHVSDIAGLSALVTIYKGEVITANVVVNDPDQVTTISSYLHIPKGYVALTIPASELQDVGGYPAQGDYINVIASVDTGLFSRVNPRPVTGTVFNNVYILEVGPPSLAPKQGQGQGLASSLTVVLTQCDAQFMEWFLLNATLKYELLSYQDYNPTFPPPDPACPSNKAPRPVGPAAVDARWHFTKA
jgi:Flp pilus assembly protein CpaB